MANDILKQNALDNETEIKILKVNQHRCAVVALCRCLGIPRYYVYYQGKATKQNISADYANK